MNLNQTFKNIRIALGNDHAGYDLKKTILNYLTLERYQVDDKGSDDKEPVDYPDYARAVSKNVQNNQSNYGILICGSGIGMSIAANRYNNIRAALCDNPLTTKLSRTDDNANILVLGSRLIGSLMAIECVKIFLNTPFEGGRHSMRLQKIEDLMNEDFNE